jgi:hypothetical protein
MRGDSEIRLLVVWCALVAITLLSWWIGSHHGNTELRSNATISFAVLLIAAIKIRVIIREFMEVREAPAWLQRLTDGWIVFLVVALLGIYTFRLSVPPTI